MKTPESEDPDQAYCNTTPNKQQSSSTDNEGRTQYNSTSTITTTEQQNTTTSTNNEERVQYQKSKPTNTVGTKNKKNKIKEYFTVQSTTQQQQRRTSTNAEKKKNNNNTTTQKTKEIEKMQKFMSRFKCSKEVIACESLPTQAKDGSTAGKNCVEESPSLMTSARQQNISESSGFATPTNLRQSEK